MIADYELVALSKAHHLVGVSRATIYRWKDNGWLDVEMLGDVGYAVKPYVRAGHVRQVFATKYARRHADGSARPA